jgi:hypothetical protein
MRSKLLFNLIDNMQRKLLLIVFTVVVAITIINSSAQSDIPIQSLSQEIENSKTVNDDKIILLVYTDLNWIGEIQDGDYVSHLINGEGNSKYSISCGETNVVSISINPGSNKGNMDVYLIKDGKILEDQFISTPGEAFESSISCLEPEEFQSQDAEAFNKFDYLLVVSSVIAVIVIFIIIRYRYFIKQNKTR